MKDKKEFIQRWGELYRKTLLQDVVPFWMKYSLDSKSGAINNCLDDDGTLISEDRYIWSQGRALWTFSALYNRVEKRQEWLDTAQGIYGYLSCNGRDSSGKWMYKLDAQGNVIEKDISIYADAFVLNGLGEYYAATRNQDAATLAVDTFKNSLDRIRTPGSYGIAPYAIPKGMKTHGINMIFSFFYYNLGKILGRPDISQIGYMLAKEILSQFYIAEKDVVLEYLMEDGQSTDSPSGRVCIPGHVLESMWFLITIFEDTGEEDLIQQCCKLIKRHLELGWDRKNGGMILAVDIDGKQPVFWQKADCKPLWTQLEAMVASTYAYLYTNEDWCLKWHEKIQNYAYSHYPVPTGEWTQWLDYDGNKCKSAALPVKDPFHLPRTLIYLMELFEKKIPQKMCI